MRRGFVIAMLALTCSPAHAEWQRWEAATAITEADTTIFDIRKDGSYTAEADETVHVLKRRGIEDYGVTVLRYTRGTERVELLEAETLNGSESVPVDRATVEDKPRASSLSGFDDVHQIKFAFPAVREGSRLHKKYRKHVERSPVPGFFSSSFTWGTEAESASRLLFVSELPLEYTLTDPQGAIQVTRGTKDGKHTLEVVQTKRLFTSISDENKAGWPLSQITALRVSSLKDWSGLARQAGRPFEEVLSSPLPPALAEIAEAAGKEKSSNGKINAAVRLFSEKFRYQGDWRAVNGGYMPRSLKDIAASGYGDCKDFATSMTAILRKMGISAHVAWVYRDRNSISADTRLPSLSLFNHAIVFIDEGERWLDPTNDFRPVEIMPADIAARPAMILDANNPRLVMTAAERPEESRFVFERRTKPAKDGWEEVEEHEIFEGASAFPTTTSILFDGQSYEAMKQKDLSEAGFPVAGLRFTKVDKPTVMDLVRFESRYSFRTRNIFYRTNAGEVYPTFAPSAVLDDVTAVVPETRAGDFLIDRVRSSEMRRFYEGRHASGSLPSCRIRSPWMDADRSFTSTPEGLWQKDVAVTKVRRIPVESVRSPAFRKLQDELRDCYLRVGIAFRPRK